MTPANKITMSRIIIAPLFFGLFQLASQQVLNVPGSVQIIVLVALLLLFIASELSDLLDGIVARRMNQVSGVGKLMDPFGDVLSRVTYFFCFYQVGIMPTYAFILILWREISMLFVRQLVQLYGQEALPARWAGKVKAVIYFITTILGLLAFLFANWPGLGYPAIVGQAAGLGSGDFDKICAFTLNRAYFQNIFLAIYTVVHSWLLPLSFLVCVIASWYSFALYLKDFLPTLKNHGTR
ncbi:CDP-alcohol phosphatidyltransferase family protein [Candidatus Haliotispira prima]|uniref:CDP-diacylglycerol--glycerol-3-phosphate 3-phosphatidyltransferase n=1 Tax=Candidatus Haliotispira prima TaxID=3034016 RepID=A0ABY8MHD8_9SPIO|nr:CDP-alcohol phosphatidyltransferase family protein [Candidatus Haliotispira prima]